MSQKEIILKYREYLEDVKGDGIAAAILTFCEIFTTEMEEDDYDLDDEDDFNEHEWN